MGIGRRANLRCSSRVRVLQVVHSRAQLICGAGSCNNFGSTAAVSSGDSRAGSGGMEPGLLALQMAEAC